MAETTTTWTEQDFDSLCWHDCHVHGIRLRNPDEGYDFDLVLDIDYILEWITVREGFNFSVAPALLTFREVDKLVVDLELAYKEHLEISSIQRQESVSRPELGLCIYQWVVRFQPLASRDNQIRFLSDGFVQTLTKPARTIESQHLEDGER
jgi:hypothetical protein